MNTVALTPMSDAQLIAALDDFKQSHPQIEEAMRVFQISDAAYQVSLHSLYGARVTYTDATVDGSTRIVSQAR